MGKELSSAVHMCVILVFLCMMTFFHHPDVSHVERARSCSAACMEDCVKVWSMCYFMEETATGRSYLCVLNTFVMT